VSLNDETPTETEEAADGGDGL
jgi:hypothetical protein